jgi:hypothetical protein
MELQLFPFDTQVCPFKLGSKSYTADLVDFVPRIYDSSGNGMLATGTAAGSDYYEPDASGRVMSLSAVGESWGDVSM